MTRFHLAATLSAATALLLAGTAAAAAFDGQQVVVVVKATDADLHTVLGAKALAQRIRNAAAEACGRDFPIAVRFSDGFIACREAAIDRTIKNLHAPLLAEALGRSAQLPVVAVR
jgi:UrcA family protein